MIVDPDRFDITREAPAVLTFGGGVHHCVGAKLARLELAEALKILTRRMPNGRIVGHAPWKPMVSISGRTTLPIELAQAEVTPAQPTTPERAPVPAQHLGRHPADDIDERVANGLAAQLEII